MKQRSTSRFFFLILAVFALVIASCGSDSDSEGGSDSPDTTAAEGGAPTADLKVGMVYDVGGKGDKSFNDSAFEGLTKAADELGVEVKDLEPAADGSNREQLVRQLADEGYGLIIGVGFAFDEVMPGIAGDYPDIDFAVVDGSAEAENIALLQFAEQEGSFLVGAIAAQTSETGTIGFIGGVENGLIQKFEAGYVAGAEAVNPDINIEIKYISPDGDFSGFNDAAAAETIADGFYDGGADVVYHASGASGEGLFKSAVKADKWAIGVDSNQYLSATPEQQEHILTSMLKRVDVSVFDIIQTTIDGDFAAGSNVFDLSNDGVGYATDGDFIEDTDAIDALKQQVIDGEIEVPSAP